MMELLIKIIQNETPEEVILMFTRREAGISLPVLDRYYVASGWPHVKHNLGLFDVIYSMKEAGLIEQSNLQITKGPRWREATFIVEKKYPLE